MGSVAVMEIECFDRVPHLEEVRAGPRTQRGNGLNPGLNATEECSMNGSSTIASAARAMF